MKTTHSHQLIVPALGIFMVGMFIIWVVIQYWWLAFDILFYLSFLDVFTQIRYAVFCLQYLLPRYQMCYISIRNKPIYLP